VLVGSLDRPNLTYRVRRGNLHNQLRSILERHDGNAGIITASRGGRWNRWRVARRRGHRVCRITPAFRTPCGRASGGLSRERADIVVATVAFGMGIDRSNVRFVVHAGAEVGRALRQIGPRGPRRPAGRMRADLLGRFVAGGRCSGQRRDDAERRTLLADMQRYAGGTLPATGPRRIFRRNVRPRSCGACDWCLKELDVVGDRRPWRESLSSVARLKQG
jgi:ATP-dependent DNA helicase RecQ